VELGDGEGTAQVSKVQGLPEVSGPRSPVDTDAYFPFVSLLLQCWPLNPGPCAYRKARVLYRLSCAPGLLPFTLIFILFYVFGGTGV
jgi:hypothetical protein